MKKYLLLGVLFSNFAFAGEENKLSIGLGQPYGGFLGAKYSISYDTFRFYGGLGFLGYTTETGSKLGYSLGFERQLSRSKHSLGLSVGTVGLYETSTETPEYRGASLNYAYYFSGFTKRSWHLGASAYAGERDTTNDYKKRKQGIFINAGYQF